MSFQSYQADFWNLGPNQVKAWQIRQGFLAGEFVFRSAGELLKRFSPSAYSTTVVTEFLQKLSETAMPLLLKGAAENPLHHSFQVAHNMLKMLFFENGFRAFSPSESYQLQAYIALCVLHDIGDAEVTGKAKTSEIRNAKDNGQLEKAKELAIAAVAFRKGHMEAGVRIAMELLKNHFPELGTWHKWICDIIAIHDNPTIAFIMDEFPEQAPGNIADFLIRDTKSPTSEGAIMLREADRLWMLSPLGLEKDLMDSLVAGKKPKTPEEQLLYNLGRFDDEKRLLEECFHSGKPGFGELMASFFRTHGGAKLYREFLDFWKTFPQMKNCQGLAPYLGQ